MSEQSTPAQGAGTDGLTGKPLISQEQAEQLDRTMHVSLAKLTGGMSPAAIPLAYLDWLIHLWMAPGKRGMLLEQGMRNWGKLAKYTLDAALGKSPEPLVAPTRSERRFSSEAWNKFPFNVMSQQFLLSREWWESATSEVLGLEAPQQRLINFAIMQMVDATSPSNAPLTNPDVLSTTKEQKGKNLVEGMWNLVTDWQQSALRQANPNPDGLTVGKDLAVTEGEVVFRNEVMEVLQYKPTTENVYAEPILFVPAWIMKYYILDLRQTNSLYKFLVDQGHTVFTISWINPEEEHRDFGMETYLTNGVLKAIEVVQSIVPKQKIHTVGYCLGGTILSIANAYLGKQKDSPVASQTLFAAQVDFTEPGELGLFITEAQVAFLESQMWKKGYLTGEQMAGTFQALRSNDLVWGKMVEEYMMGNKSTLNDLMAWNADTTRMPYRMHSEYLRHMFLDNELSRDRYKVNGETVSLNDIRVPIFTVGTETDHVAPWKSVWKVNLLVDSDDITFALTSGGHNAGIVSPVGHPRRSHRISTSNSHDLIRDPDEWASKQERQQGSWWGPWEKWLSDHSSKEKVAPPAMGSKEFPGIEAAPGQYILG
ncbi:alpha/beta fold hydrolase [Ammonicoccus fulvus]|uniref:Alpha/beta fold hydrolase n=1 Tax=Ammonicoccus fulvus TaxID=3138240 RepID=A0ABZ3FMN6_9ACTN